MLNVRDGRPASNRGRHASFVARVLATVLLLAFGSVVMAQNEAVPPAKDAIFARKIVMATIDMNMDEVETMLAPGGKLNDADARDILTSFQCCSWHSPHLFPPRHQPMAGGRGSRCRARYICLSGTLGRFSRLL